MAEFQTPSFLQNHSVDDVFQEMQTVLPSDIDLSQGGHAFNLTMPTALVVAELCQFVLPGVIQLIFPEFSYGEFLDFHAATRGMTRRPATAAVGEITITGNNGTIIPAGSVFSTASINEYPSVDYATTESVVISNGSVTVTVQCTQTGVIGNTGVNTIIIPASRITGITSVTNEDEITGGTAEESDESLIARIKEYDQSQGNSFVGNASDYRRWAKSVAGVGNVSVIPAQDDSGLVTIVLTDANGDPANEALCQDVYNYIMQPDDPYSRLAPINALLEVQPPETFDVCVQATIELVAGNTLEAITEAYLTQVAAYLIEAITDAEVKWTKMAAILSAIDGVNDFSDFVIGTSPSNLGTSNIPIGSTELPVISASKINFGTGTV